MKDRPLHEAFFSPVINGRFPLAGLITHTMLPGEAQAAYELVTFRDENVLGVVFQWPTAAGG